MSMNVRLFITGHYEILKNHNFGCEKVKVLPSFTQHYDGRHYVALKSVNR